MSHAEPTHHAHVAPLEFDELGDVQSIIETSMQASGYAPTSLRIMARRPAMLKAFSALFQVVMRSPSTIPVETKWLLAHAVSAAAGCRYCEAHTGANSVKSGLDVRKVEALVEAETSPLFSDTERAVVAFGLAAGQVPNGVGATHFNELRRHFTDDEIVEFTGVISMFGWLNRWNDTLASDLEAAPLAFADEHLQTRGWHVGKHGSTDT